MQNIEVDSSSLYVHHHLGFGDHIICNGLVRFLLKQLNPKDLWLVVKNKNLNNIKRMYSDNPCIKFVPIEKDSNFYDMPFQWANMRLVRCGFEKCRESDFDVSFYDSVGIPFIERWNSWYCPRDLNCEDEMIKELNLPDKFILVHDISSVGTFDLKIKSNLPIVKVSKLKSERSMFDWIGIIERATEIHCIDSSFIHLVNSVNLNTDSLYYHMIKPSKLSIKFKKNWSCITY